MWSAPSRHCAVPLFTYLGLAGADDRRPLGAAAWRRPPGAAFLAGAAEHGLFVGPG